MPSSDSSSTSAPASSSASGIPSIRTFQFDSGSIGELASAVNLFRGDVNIPQKLFSLPGRTSGSGLDVDVTVLYQSNVYRQAILWNRDAPTGVLGLGWSMPLTYIEAASSGSPDPDTRSYTLFDNGTPNTLVRQPQAPVLFTMPASLAKELRDGSPVPSDVRSQFLQHGLPLSTTAIVNGAADSWTVTDDDLQQLFALESDSEALRACGGGQSYQLQNYRFWQIQYYPRYERWLIVDDGGVRKDFGGANADTGSARTSAGNSVAWEVWWTLSDQVAWSGPSTETDGQKQVARAWYLSRVSDRFGDAVTYDYETVEQPVGSGGLPYTKAVYLSCITDVFGRTATLSYGDKLWGPRPDDPREYCDPHRDVPSDDANAFQDRYETKYLDQILVCDTDGGELFKVRLKYDPRPEVAAPLNQVANVSDNTGALAGDTFKRYLTGVRIENPDGDSLPGFDFDYYLDADDEEGQPGALARITWPQGGTARYAYTRQDLSVCERKQDVPRPDDVPEGAAPRVFFGSDYVVSTWYNANNGILSLQVYTWMGRWLCWQLDDADPVLDTQGLDLDTLQVLANEDFFLLHFDRNDTSDAYVFDKDIARPGQWIPATIDGVTTAKDKPPLSFSLSSGTVSYVGGDTFFAAAEMNMAKQSWRYSLLTFRWTTREWTRKDFTPANFTYLAASREYLLALDLTGRVELAYLDGALEWQDGSSLVIADFNPSSYDKVALTPGDSLVAVSNLIVDNSQQRVYDVILLQWDARHGLQSPPFTQRFTDPIGTGNAPLTAVPSVISDRLVVINGNLLRFNGANWLSNTNLAVRVPQANTTQRYSYGPDYALQIVASTRAVGQATAKVLPFDPDQDSTAWQAQPVPSKQPLPTSNFTTDNWPTGGGADYAVLGPYLYFRGTATSWGDVVGADAEANIADLAAGTTTVERARRAAGSDGTYRFDSESLINEGPVFMSYSAFPETQPTSKEVQTLVLRNGQVMDDAADVFDEERMFTPSEENRTGSSGVSPQGPWVFVSYPASASSFDSAPRIFLHRYAGDAVSGPISHYPVTRLDIDDQYQDVASTSYRPDASHAGCDPSGLVVKYFTNTTYPGSADPDTPSYGSVTSQYLNGLEIRTGENYYDMLDGLLHATETRDSHDRLLESQTNDWYIFEEVASDPRDGNAPTIPLRGGWVSQVSQLDVVDGLTTERTMKFVPKGLSAPYTGRPATTVTRSHSGSGKPETFTRVARSAVAVNAAMRALNMRAIDAQTKTFQQSEGGIEVPVTATAATYTSWPSAAGDGVEAPAQEASFRLLDAANVDFPYDDYSAGDSPAGWLLDARVLIRTSRGQPRESEDAGGTATAVHFSSDLTFPVAQIANSRSSGAAYLGFEPYEDTTGWTFQGTKPDTNDARTGTTSLLLPAGAKSQAGVTVTPSNEDQTYVVGCWYQTPAGFTPADDAGWSVTVITDGQSGAPQTTPFAATDGQWTFRSIGVPLTAGAKSLELVLQASNTTASDVLLDCLFLVPLVGGLLARTFDAATHQVTSILDAGGRTRWSFFDRYRRPTLQVGPNGQAKELVQRFLSRQGNGADSFDRMSPNAELTLHPADGGTVETFRDGDAWMNLWKPADPAKWTVSDGALEHSGATSDSLAWQGTSQPTWAAYFEVAPADDKPDLTLQLGEVSVRYAGGAYAASAGGPSWQALATPPSMARHWLLVAGDGVILFFGDGQLLFSERGTFATDSLTITAASPLTFRHMATLQAPRLGLSLNDGAARQRQVHQLHGADSRVSQLVFDPLGRQVAATRFAPGSFGSGAKQPVLQYRPGFLDVPAFLASLSGSWKMSGDIADYYQGQVVDGVPRSDDEGYPYRGTRWEDSPRERRLELGSAGKRYAIHDIGRTTEAQRVTTQFEYGANDGATPPLPAGDYQQTTVTSPVKTQAKRLTDKVGQSVATVFADATGATVGQTSGDRRYAADADGPETTLTVQLPNALTAGPQSGDAGYLTQLVQDAAGRTSQRVDPDAHQIRFIYELRGRPRFIQPALDDGEQWFVYYKYDAVGRTLEQGTVEEPWDEDRLSRLADQPSWPDATVPHSVAIAWSYDGDGNHAHQIGQKVRSVTTTAAPDGVKGGQACVATEDFTYDPSGRLRSVSLKVSGPASAEGITAYAYNNLSEVTRLTLPARSPLAEVVYSYDDQGKITGIGTSADSPRDIASYTYTADGEVESETLGDGAWVRKTSYASPGWVKQTTAASADEKQSLSLAYTFNPDGSVASRKVDFAFTSCSASLADSYAYDGQGRLQSAVGDSDLNISAYDPNGNIWALTQAGTEQSFPLAEGTDRIAEATVGGETLPVSYDARGQLTGAWGQALQYDPSTSLTSYIAGARSQLQLGYGGHQQRVLKQVTGDGAGTTIYFNGPGEVPVAQLTGSQWKALVQGPTGIVAVVADQTYYPLKDNEQSAWALVNERELVARYVYLPFGAQVTADGPDPEVLSYRFMGQEWDGEVGLYNFNARMYDPVLRRFLAPDPARQFASPYVFAANNPLIVVDPTGEISVWAQVGIGAAMVAVAIAGVALTVATAGAAAPGVAAAEGGLGAAAVGGEAAAVGAGVAAEAAGGAAAAGAAGAEVGGAAAAAGAVEGGAAAVAGGAVAEGGAVAAGEVAAGAAAGGAAAAEGGAAAGGAAATSAFSWSTNLTYLGIQAAGGAITGAGTSGLMYDIQHGRDFTAAGFFEAVGIGAASGFVSGALGGLAGMPATQAAMAARGLSVGLQAGIRIGIKGVAGAVGADLSQVLTNVSQHQPWYQGLAQSTALGFAKGAGLQGLSEAASNATSIARGVGVSEETIQRVTTLADRAKSAATSQDAYMIYGTAAFFLVSGYAVWGAADNWGQDG